MISTVIVGIVLVLVMIYFFEIVLSLREVVPDVTEDSGSITY